MTELPPEREGLRRFLASPALWAVTLAFAVGFARARSAPVAGDAAYQLVRVGEAWLRGLPNVLSVAPGAADAPVLGAIVTALGTLFATSRETMTRPLAALLLGTAAAVLVLALRRKEARPTVVFAVLLLTLPPLCGTSFALRPDAALGGVLLLIASALFGRARHRTLGLGIAWAAVLTTPLALPVAVLFQLLHDRQRQWALSRSAALAPILLTLVIVALSLSLPAGSRSEVVRGIFSLPRWPAFFAALLPMACYLSARALARVPDPGAAPDAPSRALYLAFVVPLALFVFAEDNDRSKRRRISTETARHAQIAAYFQHSHAPPGAFLAERVGALAGHTQRPVVALGGDLATLLADSAVGVAVLGRGGQAETPRQARLLQQPLFKAEWAPYALRRGKDRDIDDLVWVRRSLALSRFAPGGTDARGLQDEELGLAAARAAQPAHADSLFRRARMDPATARARIRLADAALSGGAFARADSLLLEAAMWSPDTPGLSAVRARRHALSGSAVKALEASAHAVLPATAPVRAQVNHGTLLWVIGEHSAARLTWDRAVQSDPQSLRFLGNYHAAPDSSPPPPLLPLYGSEEAAAPLKR